MVIVVVPMYAGIATIVLSFKALFPGAHPDVPHQNDILSSHALPSSEIG